MGGTPCVAHDQTYVVYATHQIMLGTMRRLRGKDFCVIYRRNPVLVLEFKNEKFERWIIPASAENIALLGAKGFTV